MFLHTHKYKIETQSELLTQYVEKELLEKRSEELSKEYHRLHKEHLSTIEDQLSKVYAYLDCVKNVDEIYEGKPLKVGWADGIYSVHEIMADHNRDACWYDELLYEGFDDWKTGIFYDDDYKTCVHYFYDFEEFKTHAKDWVVFGKISSEVA